MKSQPSFRWVFILLFFVFSSAANAAPEKVMLASKADLPKEFGCSRITEPVHGKQYFIGFWRRDSTFARNLYVYDEKASLVSVVLSEKELLDMVGGDGFADLALSPNGVLLALGVMRLSPSAIIHDMMALDLETQRIKPLVADGRRNYNPAFSPDGRHIAYFSTDPRMDAIYGVQWEHSAGRVVEVQTGDVATLVEPFEDNIQWVLSAKPQWLDDNRVVFCTMSTNLDEIRSHVPEFSGLHCPVAVLANLKTKESRSLFFPNAKVPPVLFVDAARSKIFIGDNVSVIMESDYDFESTIEKAKANPGERVILLGLNPDGTPNLLIRPLKR